MTAVCQQHIRPKPFQNLVGHIDKPLRFPHGRRTLGSAGGRGHERDADAFDGQIDDLDEATETQIGPESLTK
jgi:hypothetical protein